MITKELEDNFLDGDKIDDCGSTTFTVEGALDIAKHFYELGQEETLEWVEKEALRYKQENKGLGISTKTRTLLSIHRLNYHILRDYDLGVEYRELSQRERRECYEITEKRYRQCSGYRTRGCAGARREPEGFVRR